MSYPIDLLMQLVMNLMGELRDPGDIEDVACNITEQYSLGD